MIVTMLSPPRLYLEQWRGIYLATVGVMIFVFVFAEAVRGSKRWVDLGPFQFQPSEFGKLFFILAIAGFLVERGRRVGELSHRRRGNRARARADAARLPPARPRYRPRVRRRAGRRPLPRGVRWLHLALLAASTLVLLVGVLWLSPLRECRC